MGYEFIDRDGDDNCIIKVSHQGNDKMLKYKLLDVCEFTSSRKRMSCIFEDPNGSIVLMCKGADSVIEKIMS